MNYIRFCEDIKFVAQVTALIDWNYIAMKAALE